MTNDDEHDDYYCTGDEEWPPGQCDNCTGCKPGDGVDITPICACIIGQGAGPEDCVCGPEDGDGDA